MLSKFLQVPFLLVPFLSLLFAYSPSTTAAYPKTDAEFAKLPKYCSARFSRPGSSPERWIRVLGRKNWIHLHHYCNALNKLNKANLLPDSDEKIELLNKAIRGFKGQIKATEPTYVLRPEIYLKMGESYSQLRQYSAAIKSYNNAIKIKPNYTSAYASKSDIYKKMGDRSMAVKTLKKGLKYKPNSKRLKRRLKKLEK